MLRDSARMYHSGHSNTGSSSSSSSTSGDRAASVPRITPERVKTDTTRENNAFPGHVAGSRFRPGQPRGRRFFLVIGAGGERFLAVRQWR